MTRLGKCAKNNDAQAATALFQELVDSGVSCTAQICATFIHIYSCAPLTLTLTLTLTFLHIRSCARAPPAGAE